MNIVVIIGQLILYMALHLFFSGYLMRRRLHNLWLVVGALIYVVISTVVQYSNNTLINFAQTFTINIIIAVIFYKDKFIKLVSFTILNQFIGVMADLFVAAAITALSFTYLGEVRANRVAESFGILLTSCVVLMTVIFFRKKFKEKYYCDSLRDSISMLSFLLLSSVVMTTVFRVLYFAKIPIAEHIILLFLLPSMLFSSFILFFQYGNTLKLREAEMELEANKEMEKVRGILLKQHEKNIDEKNAIIHDYKNNILHLIGIINQSEIALAYCNELVDNCSNQLTYYSFNVGNEILNIILGKLKYDCEQEDIDLDLQISYGKFGFISPLDTSSLFGNLFDNAINSCRIVKQNRWIKVKISSTDDFAYVTVANSRINDIVSVEGEFLSTRRNYKKRGYGVNIIKTIARRYHGDSNISYEDQSFTCTIWLNKKI